MGRIKSLKILGFKKFEKFNIDFNENTNILVGENEAGKSTILDAISIVLNQKYQNSDKSILKDLLNVNQIEKYLKSPSSDSLPYIYIELELILEKKEKNSEYFWGENNSKGNEAFGIVFECKTNDTFSDMIDESVKRKKIPYEYYTMKWTTFAGLPYYQIKKPFNYLYINTSEQGANTSFNYYNRALFNSTYDDVTKMNAKNSFRENISEAFTKIKLSDIDSSRKFGINDKKIILESIISVYEDSIAIENRGSGMESLIKTQIALDKAKSNLDVILIEEPENHLCYTNMNKMLEEISKQKSTSQLIISTHSNMVATRLNLKNVFWITQNIAKSLNTVDDSVAYFFVKADNNSFLQFLLSERIVLVEGATEALLFPKLYKMVTDKTLEEDKISIISCNGISFKNYLKIAKGMNKRIAVLTDNDNNKQKISWANEYNNEHKNSRIFLNPDTSLWTWEVCFYKLNEEYFDKLVKPKNNYDYKFHGENYGRTLGKMLNHKVSTAYKMLLCDDNFTIPEYIKDAIKWIKE